MSNGQKLSKRNSLKAKQAQGSNVCLGSKKINIRRIAGLQRVIKCLIYNRRIKQPINCQDNLGLLLRQTGIRPKRKLYTPKLSNSRNTNDNSNRNNTTNIHIMDSLYMRQQRTTGTAAQGQTVQAGSGRPVAPLDAARANDVFDHFLNASTLKSILGHYRLICDLLHLRPSTLPNFYPKLKQHLTSWRAKAVWKKFDARANNKAYGKGRVCPDTRVLVIGAGPCGLRTAIEAQMLGAKVVVLEKRDRMSRNNVLHLWPFVIDDLRSLGAKKFFGKFCAGSIDHISIRQLQCIVLKVALLLGVEIHTEVSYESLVEPSAENKRGWRASVTPHDHPVSQYEFDVIIGADGKRNTLQGFKRKEFRGKLAIAITANFINRRTEAEARVEEISGVAFIFNQKFFKDLYAETQIDLENIVYYKDDTHYFVMTAKKHSLLSKSVIRSDQGDTARLLSPDNVDRDALMSYAREAAEFSTGRQMLDLEFAVNHYGQPDVAMFDFTSMYAAENASRVVQRGGYRLLCILVGDSLLEPFWPTGSGCARGFLSSLDAAWAIRAWGSGTPALSVLAERESIYRLLGGTTPENLHRDSKSYALDPSSRYPKLNRQVLTNHQVVGLYDTDDVEGLKAQTQNEIAVQGVDIIRETVAKRRRIDEDDLLCWIKKQIIDYNLEIPDLSPNTFKDGKILCAILHHYRPDLVDFKDLPEDDVLCCHIAIELLEKEIGIPSIVSPNEIASMENSRQQLISYLSQIHENFKREIAHINHPKMLFPPPKVEKSSFTNPMKFLNKKYPIFPCNTNKIKKSPNKKECLVSSLEKDTNIKRNIIVGDGSIKKLERKIKKKSFSENFHKNSSMALQQMPLNINADIQQEHLKITNIKTLSNINETQHNTADLIVKQIVQNDENFKDKLLFHCPNILIKNETNTDTQYVKVWSVSDYLLIVPKTYTSMVKYFSDTTANGTNVHHIATMDNPKDDDRLKCCKEIALKNVEAHYDIFLQEENRTTDEIFAKHFLRCCNFADRKQCCKFQKDISYNSKNLICPCQLLKLTNNQHNYKKKYCMQIEMKNNDLSTKNKNENVTMISKSNVLKDNPKIPGEQQSSTINVMTLSKSNNKSTTVTLSTKHNVTSTNSQFRSSNGVRHTRGNHLTRTHDSSRCRAASGWTSSKVLKYGAGKHTNMWSSPQAAGTRQSRRVRTCQQSPPPSTISDRIRVWLRTNDFEDRASTVINMKGVNKGGGRVEDELRHVDELLGQQRNANNNNNGGDNCTDITGLTSVTKSPPLWERLVIVDRGGGVGDREAARRAESVIRFGQNGEPVGRQQGAVVVSNHEKEHHQRKTGSNATSHSNNSAKNSNKIFPNNETLSSNPPKQYRSPTRSDNSKNDQIPIILRTKIDNNLQPKPIPSNVVQQQPQIDKDHNLQKLDQMLLANKSKFNVQSSVGKPELNKNNDLLRVAGDNVEVDEDSNNSMEELAAILMNRFRGVDNGLSSALAEHNSGKVRVIQTVSNPFSAITEKDDDEVTPNEMPELKPHTLNALASGARADPPMHHRNFTGARVPAQTKSPYVRQAVPLVPATPSSVADGGAPSAVVGGSRSGRKRKSATTGGAAGGAGGATGLDHTQNQSQLKNERDEDFAARIRQIEDKWYETTTQDPNTDRHNITGVAKKPKDLMRAIGKIETSDWNIREIEKKIRENRSVGGGKGGKERVPKWSREQFQARQAKMERKHILDRQDSTNGKYSELDKNLKILDQRLKEGTVRELNQHKIAKITEQLKPKHQTEKKREQKANEGIKTSTSFVLPSANNSEYCHFCSKRVYLMEKLCAENRSFHKNCFRCEYCHTLLRPGAYKYDAEGKYGHRFYCIHHYGFSGQLPAMVSTRNKARAQKNDDSSTPVKKRIFSEDINKGDVAPLSSNREGSLSLLGRVTGVDLLDRVQTPERIEFSNLTTGNAAFSDHEEPPSIMDEDEWTDRNFGASTAEVGSSDEDDSYSDSDSEEEYEEAVEEPATKEGNMRILEQYSRFSRKHDSDSEEYSSSEQSSYCENTSGDEESDTATEGEEEIRARELRKQEVRLEPPIITDTGTDTEINSDDTAYSKSNEAPNSATEISTDSEFAQDEPTPTREIPSIVFNDAFVTKTRGTSNITKVQVTSGELRKHNASLASKNKKVFIEPKKTEVKPIVPNDILQTVAIKKPTNLPLLNRVTDGFPLNRTQSTSGIAAIRSLELKKRYLLGEAAQTSTNASGIQKSGSASTLDSKLKSFHSNITDRQKMLNPTHEVLVNESTKSILDMEIPKPLFVCGASAISNISKEQINNSADKLTDTDRKDKDTAILEKNGVQKQEPAISLTSNTSTLVQRTELQSTSVNTEIQPKEISQPKIVKKSEKFENELEGRPRSPVHETSIIVPKIDWTSKNKHEDDYSDSMSSESENDEVKIQEKPSVLPMKPIENIVSNKQVDNCKLVDLELLDSLNYIPSISDIAPKSISSEKKTLNQPKTLPGLYNMPEQTCIQSGRSTPTHGADSCITGFLTETELSDWARDGAVSDDFDYDYEQVVPSSRRHKEPKKLSSFVGANNKDDLKTSLNLLDLDRNNSQHVCGKADEVVECVNSILNPNLKNIEYMDTGSENSSCSDDNIKKNNGYVQFYNENDMAEDSLSPVINNLSKLTILEIKNPLMTAKIDDMTDFDELSTPTKNTGFCEVDVTPTLSNCQTNFGGKVVDLNPTDLEELKQKQTLIENEMDSLQVIDTGTEDNTCSDSTVKNVEDYKPFLDNNNVNLDKKRLEDKLMQVKQDMLNKKDSELYVEHCQRLQGKISEFTNVRDSIDVRKNSQKNQQQATQPDLIQQPEIRLNLTPNNLYKKEIIAKERDLNQRLIHEMILNKYKTENKSLERRKRSRNNSFSPKIFELSKSATTVDLGPQTVLNTPGNVTPDVILSTTQQNPLQKSQTMSEIPNFPPKSTQSDCYVANTPRIPQIQKVYTCYQVEKTPSYEKIRQEARAKAKLLSDKDLGLSPEDKILRLRERIRGFDSSGSVATQPNKTTALNRTNSNVIIRDTKSGMPATNRNSIAECQFNRINTHSTHNNIYSNDTLNSKKRPKSFRRPSVEKQPELTTSKSVQNIISPQQLSFSTSSTNGQHQIAKTFKSDSNLLMDKSLEDFGEIKEGTKKKSKDRERRKSITKFFSDFFVSVRKDGSNYNAAKGFLAKISPKTRERSKSCINLPQDKLVKEMVSLRKSASSDLHFPTRDTSPPPVPPLPDNYAGNKLEDSSEAELEFQRHCSMENIDPTSPDCVDSITNGNAAGSRRNSRGTAKRSARQAQLKRHRTAQEIQRKLEETEVKIRELELDGIAIEKRLRGEPSTATTTIITSSSSTIRGTDEEDGDWLRQWFAVMRDLTEWRRYERELVTRAEELELEDRHARLQNQLRDKLSCDTTEIEGNISGKSTEAGIILEEMMDIVAKRDGIIANLEQDKQRYADEDKEFDDEMLAKGLKLLPSHWKSIDSN